MSKNKKPRSKRPAAPRPQQVSKGQQEGASPAAALPEHITHPLLEALAPAERALIELVYLIDEPIAPPLLQKALAVCQLDPFWSSPNKSEAARRIELLRPLLKKAPDNHFAPLADPQLRRAALHGLARSGRAARVAKALQGETGKALAGLEAPYYASLRRRLRVAAALGGAEVPGMAMAQYQQTDTTAATAIRADLHALLWPRDTALTQLMASFFAGPLLAHWLRRQLIHPGAEAQALVALACQRLRVDELCRGPLTIPLLDHAVLRGASGEMDALGFDASVLGPGWRASLQAQVEADADAEAAAGQLDAHERSCVEMRKLNGPQYAPIGLMGKLHLALLSTTTDTVHLKRREQLRHGKYRLDVLEGLLGFEAWLRFLQMHLGEVPAALLPAPATGCRIDDIWWTGLLNRWLGLSLPEEFRARLKEARAEAEQAGFCWLQAQIDDVLDEAVPARARPGLRGWIQPRPAWESALLALSTALKPLQAATEGAQPQAAFSQLRVEVMSDAGSVRSLRLRLFEQKPAARGGHTAGRELSLDPYHLSKLAERLAPGDTPDRRLHSALIADREQGYYGSFSAESNVVAALVGHPRISDAEDRQPLEMIAREPALRARTLDDGRVEMSLDPKPSPGTAASLQREGQQLLLLRLNPLQRRLAGILSEPLLLPPEGMASFMQLLPDMQAALRVDGALQTLDVQECEPDSRLIVQLEPAGDGLGVQLGLRPLGEDGPFVLPGLGNETLLGAVQGRPTRCRRALAVEQAAVRALQVQVPALRGWRAEEGFRLEEPEAALELLAELQAQAGLSLEWKAGKSLRMLRPQLQDPMKLNVAAKRDWFAAEGGLSLQDGSVIALGELLRALPSAQGRFLRLDGDRIVALDAELRRRLQTLRAFADERGQVQVPAAAALALESVLDATSELDTAFRKQLQRMEEARTLNHKLPRTLQAELRDYQIEGFRFLARLAAWGAGACLADDMGLGKTVQSLALLLARAKQGPALVVAPTSLIANWRKEATRFAPSLDLRVFGEGDREAALSGLGKGDVVLASYGLLVSNIEAFEPIEFASLVLDEAQAFKNAATQRAQAVRRLRADFRMACTGTPLENHLGELWSLMRVLNPGLLGSEESFRHRFLLPMEREPQGGQREVLRRLISPFLLRRTKSQVLSELPERTEIVQTVEPSEGEARLLAALRKQALERLSSTGAKGEHKRFAILAELTRLRRAACHPDLVAPELKLGSAKLEQLVELVKELVDNRHRALVFSQFTDYLALVRQRFEAEGISYRYLDGKTAPKKREAEVAAFQEGEADVFLLSLKAGGVGLNLTAADYVIHLDPWWNPAVEQQATDRAHRIGQTRPVTVYKLVLAGSIGEQILGMHGAKRELIDQVIGDQAQASAVSVDELLGLLQDA
ncbi:MAG: DEAD/DEAH box helicase [Aquimonas sp.]|nr:DEAD/DEAH box helicase [Aquimonas sp.]